MVLKVYKHEDRIICYIKKHSGIFSVNTGKPSDRTCSSWQYSNQQEAERAAEGFFKNFTTH